MTVGRNEPCPCGSGKKSKNCCGGKGSPNQVSGLTMLFAAIVIIAAVGLIASLRNKDKTTTTPAPAAAFNPGAPQPGVAPPGKVWSSEHGHWHDAAPAGAQTPASAAGLTPKSDNSAIKIEPLAAGTPVPPTTAPITINTPNVAQPPGPAPAGKVWSAEHGHWHDAAAPQATAPAPVVQTTTTPQPPGPVPAGKVWSPEHGHWHDVPKP